jgi:glucose-1-phosphate cytidylyltransferase
MKVGFLAGGKGTRLIGESGDRPKPMILIGNEPILVHIMRHYSNYGFTEFIIATGYMGDHITEYFSSRGEVVSCPNGCVRVMNFEDTDWTVDLVDTGVETNTGGRIKRLAPYLGDATFMLTWGDGLSDVNLDSLLSFHREHGCSATVTAVHPPPRFGRLSLDDDCVVGFAEKDIDYNEWINGAFFVLEPEVFEYIDDDLTVWEKEPMHRLVSDRQFMAFRHTGFWQCMDTPYEKQLLNSMWAEGNTPWLDFGE